MSPDRPAAIIDVDGTLVDSVYQHALSWHRAFATVGIVVPVWRCHRAIGMGGDQLVPELIGEEGEREHGERLRELENERFSELIDEVKPFERAGELVEALAADREVVLASSAEEHEVKSHIEELGVGERIVGYTCSDDVEASKPDPDLIESALAKLSGDRAVVIGDSVWDVEAAKRAELPCIGLLSGGFSEAELREAGATDVFSSPAELLAGFERTALG